MLQFFLLISDSLGSVHTKAYVLWVFSALFARPNEKLNDYIEQHSAQWDEIISINSTLNVKQISKITRYNH